MVNIEPGNKYLEREERPYTSGEAPSIAVHVQNSLRKFVSYRTLFRRYILFTDDDLQVSNGKEDI